MADTDGNLAKLHDYTFQDSGVKIKIRKVSPLLAMQLQNDFPPPQPPLQPVTMGDKVEMVANASSPEYVQMLNDYQREFELKLRGVILKRGVVIEMTDETKAQIASIRADYKEVTGKELAGSDELVYLSYIAVATSEDLTDLVQNIMKRSQPTEPVIGQTAKNFRR